MPYQPNIPQPTDQISTSQGDILGNFQFLNTIAIGIFDAPAQGTAPTIPAGDTALYTLLDAATTQNEMYITNQAGNSYPITAALFANDGYTILPSGIMIKWGYVAPTLPNPCTVTYDATVPFTAVFSVIANPVSVSGSDPNIFVTVNQNSVFTSTTTFQVWTSPRTTTGSVALQLFYIAIGKVY